MKTQPHTQIIRSNKKIDIDLLEEIQTVRQESSEFRKPETTTYRLSSPFERQSKKSCYLSNF